MKHIAIVGNGVAGITTAREIRKRGDHRITVISSESDYFFSRTALMYIYMGHMTYQNTLPYADSFWQKNRIDLMRDHVESIDTDGMRLRLRDRGYLAYDTLVIATGSRPNRFGWPGENLNGVGGLYSLQDLEYMEHHTTGIRRGVVVGGGLIGIEVAEMLRSRHIEVTMLVREDVYWGNILPREEAEMIGRHIGEHGIDLRIQTELAEILPDTDGGVRGVTTNRGEEIACEFVALATGVGPNIDLVRNTPIEQGRGILVNEYFETNVPNIYAAGDCAEFRIPKPDHPAIEQLWYTAAKHGQALAGIICGDRKEYDRGIWFNSAKFLDIEYQTYGMIPTSPPHGVETFYWEHTDGRHALRINYAADDTRVLGFNTFGLRLRHITCETWIAERRTLTYVMENLAEAAFEPEFFPRYEEQIVQSYNAQHPEGAVKMKRRRGLWK